MSYQILGIGTPILDLLIHINSDFLKKIGGSKGGAKAVNHETFKQLLLQSPQKPHYSMGGSTANTIKGLAQLGRTCALVGRIGKDEAGKQFLNEMAALHIISLLIPTDTPTAQVACFLSPDRERTMRSFIDVGVQLQKQDLHPEMFANTSLVQIEGYNLCFDSVTQTAMEYAKRAGAKVAFNLGSFEITNHYKQTILDLLAQYVDILFANALETKVLTSLNPEEGCDTLKDLCETAIVTMGEKGCWVGRGSEKIHQPAYQVPNVIDTTGAGDLFASGFLHGYLAKKPLRECARYGSLIASMVIQNLGVTISPEDWEKIKSQLAPLN